ncbi:hypothetical protein KBY96_08020 [Cyanobium sp. ATX 6A2]|uniref:hypothetical protein n=1 Tax=Cyanobium sp. ATX 6A2 TaxID=2823700 RepID=UPI0020CEDB16|nr:hypothetical protein [Cyanobium sp. ATX 6A2]MCP9887874.1 hypothetical protein [Cyanobium sp. ATX 6A2]
MHTPELIRQRCNDSPNNHSPHHHSLRQHKQGRQRRWAGACLGGLLPLGVALAGCDARFNEALMRQGHQAMVECQHGERAITDGDELRCEDWGYVRSNYLEASKSQPQEPGAGS